MIEPVQVWDVEYLRTMARDWYGYGWWEAPFWFIGPEPGRPEPEDTLKPRCQAWMNLDSQELIDCKKHHFGFEWYKWHRETPPPATQPTWRRLIRLLLAFRRNSSVDLIDIDGIRLYQQHHWGMRTNPRGEAEETCIIELCSLPAPNLAAEQDVPFDPNCFLNERIGVVQSRISEYKPKFVVMYGLTHTNQFQQLADTSLIPGTPKKVGPTYFVQTPAPTAHGLCNAYWIELATKLRNEFS